MNTIVVWLVFLMAAESSVSEFTDFENGIVTGAVQHKDTKMCVKFGKTSSPSKTCLAGRSPFRYCIDNLAFLDTSGCETVSLDTSGLIRVLYWCVHWYGSRDIFKAPCGDWPHQSKFENLIYASVQPNGKILLNNGENCVTKHPSYNTLTALSSSDATCQASSSRFRIVG
ncbi:hypothetical protein ACROYT_G010498 [Oculina patagonica]